MLLCGLLLQSLALYCIYCALVRVVHRCLHVLFVFPFAPVDIYFVLFIFYCSFCGCMQLVCYCYLVVGTLGPSCVLDLEYIAFILLLFTQLSRVV